MITVELSGIDRLLAATVGLQRNFSGWERGMQLGANRRDLGIESHVIGALAEYAVARYLNLNWNPILGRSDKERGDVGSYQVKSITVPTDSLIIQEDEDPRFIYILCYVRIMRVHLMGWLYGSEGRLENFKRVADGKQITRTAFFVPQQQLHAIEQIPK